MKTGIKVWEGKIKNWKKCAKCGREWTPRSLDENGICIFCKKGILIEYAPWLMELKDEFEKIEYNVDRISEIIRKKIQENFFEREELYLKCGICERYVDELYHCDLGVICCDCYNSKKWEKNREKQKDRRE